MRHENTKDLLSHIHDGAIICSHDHKIIAANKSALRILKYKREEQLVFKNVSSFIEENNCENIPYNKETTSRGIDSHGSALPLQITRISTPENKNDYILLIKNKDQNTEKKYKEISDFQNLIMKTIPDLIFVKDENFKIVSCNPAFLKVYPKELRENVIGIDSKTGYHPDEADEFTSYDRIALNEGEVEYYETIHFPDGKKRTLFTKKIRFYGQEGKKYMLGICRDVTAMKEAEEKILKSNTELEKFAYIAAHDMQEPLRIIGSFATLLETEYADKLEGNALEYIKHCIKGAKRIQHMVDDLLEYALLNNTQEKIQKIEMDDVLQTVCENLYDNISYYEANIEYEKLGIITGNKNNVIRLFQNIIGNAIKYHRSGTPPEIKISRADGSHNTVFKIIDNGIGIDPKFYSIIFEPFKRLHSSSQYKGTGIGLAICSKILENMKGKIEIESEIDKGTTFIITIPKKM
ncbi:MAG: PAS domain S-box protein [Micavibrio sp.]|nr:PAS domain S-box protein [Micavibrio sp.]